MEMHQLLQERQSVHSRHFDIQREDIGHEGENLVASHVRVWRRADHFQIRLPAESIRQDLTHNCGVVDDQNAYLTVSDHARASWLMLTTIRPLPIPTAWTVELPAHWAVGGGSPDSVASVVKSCELLLVTICGVANRKSVALSTRLKTEPQIMFASSQTTSPICCSDRSCSSAPIKSADTDRAAPAVTLRVRDPEGSPSNRRCATTSGSGENSRGSPRHWMKNIFSRTSSIDSCRARSRDGSGTRHPQSSFQLGAQNFRQERLGDIAASSQRHQAVDPLAGRVRGDHNHRDRAEHFVSGQAAEELFAIHAGHIDVREN